jgi:hypothetical protein
MHCTRLLLAVASTVFRSGLLIAAEPRATGPREPAVVAAAIDTLIDERLASAGVSASPAAADGEFSRRATLDILGRIPTSPEAIAFLDDADPDKCARLIDRLLADPQYGEHLATIWNELIQPRDAGSKKAVRDALTPWLAEQFNRGRGWDAIVADLLTVTGTIRDNPQAGFILANSENSEPQPHLLADATARLFWGVQLRCAECHDHPFAPWKQTDFWGTAAFFSRLRKGYTDGKSPNGYTFTESPPDEPLSQKFAKLLAATDVAGPAIVVPETGGKLANQVVRARFLGGDEPSWTDNGPYRERFVAWTTSADNPWFAANTVNRLWAQLMGRGLVNPLDGFQPGNPPSHPGVLDLLASELVASDFDIKHVLRIICSTRAYQRTSRPLADNADDAELYSHMAVKPLRPEMLYDSLSVALFPVPPKAGSKTPPGKPQPASGLQPLPDMPRPEFVRLFGTRTGENEGSIVNSGVPQFLRLLNGKLLNEDTPALDRLLKTRPAPGEAIESLYLTALARRPTAAESRRMTDFVAGHDDEREAYADILWALVNSAEFALNH